MAAASDKARFYLEKYVPELREYESKGIFSRDEITSITSKRSDFEHTLNARGSTPGDYARYATYEMNLDALRKKRCKRLGIKNTTTFSGQRTVFFVLDRATKKFPGDMGLWMQYINFCKKEKANKKLAKVFTSVLRLHPREWSLWVLAAKHYAETQGDMGTARSYLQRGLRFCKDEKKLYLEYVKLEIVYLAKLAARRKILGLDGKDEEEKEKVEDDENMITLPSVTAEDLEQDEDADVGAKVANDELLKKLENAPAFTGAIPMAIFDAAMKQLNNASEAAEDFFDLIATFEQVPSTPQILQHILDHLQSAAPASVEATICRAKYDIFSIDILSVDFPPALGSALAKIKSAATLILEKAKPRLGEEAILFLLPFLRSRDDLDEDIGKVLEASIKRYMRLVMEAPKKPGKQPGLVALKAKLESQGRAEDLEILTQLGG